MPGAGPAGGGQDIPAAAPAAVIAAELRVSERAVRRWRQAWLAGLASRRQEVRGVLRSERVWQGNMSRAMHSVNGEHRWDH